MTKRKYQEEKGTRIGGINEDELMDLADLFKMFADSTRIKILVDLSQGEKSVSEICEDLEMNQSAVSHQLKILRNAKLLCVRREGKSMIYSLADESNEEVIMKKKFKLDEVDCANCAAKMEDAIRKIDGVKEVSVNFMTQKMTLEAEDESFEAILDEACKVIAKVEPDCEVIR